MSIKAVPHSMHKCTHQFMCVVAHAYMHTHTHEKEKRGHTDNKTEINKLSINLSGIQTSLQNDL